MLNMNDIKKELTLLAVESIAGRNSSTEERIERVKRLVDLMPKLIAEVKRLRALVPRAFVEGMQSEKEYNRNWDSEMPPPGESYAQALWDRSETRRELGLPQPPETNDHAN